MDFEVEKVQVCREERCKEGGHDGVGSPGWGQFRVPSFPLLKAYEAQAPPCMRLCFCPARQRMKVRYQHSPFAP